MRNPGKMLGMGHEFSVASMTSLFMTLAELLLLLRVFLKFFFTTAGGGFVHWAFSTTNVLLTPFRGIWPDPTATPTNWHIDWVSLFAMMVYAAVASLILGLVGWNFGTRRSNR